MAKMDAEDKKDHGADEASEDDKGSKSKHFIQKAIKRPGALTAKAKAAGMSVAAYAKAHAHEGGQAGEESRFYRNVLARVRPGMGSKAK